MSKQSVDGDVAMRKFLIFGLACWLILAAGCAQPPVGEGVVLVPGKQAPGTQAAETRRAATAAYTTTREETGEPAGGETGPAGGTTDPAATTPAETTPAATQPAGEGGPGQADGGVFWVAGGSVWHVTDRCHSLARSREICSGTVEEAQAAGKTRPCKICSE